MIGWHPYMARAVAALASVLGYALGIGVAHAASSDGVPVLMYHEIGSPSKPPGETVIPLARFAEQMQYLADHGYTTISVDALVAHLRWGTRLPPKPVVLTFDDGWHNVLNAVPILERHGFKASFWIITGKGIGYDYMSWPDIEQLAAHPGFEVYAHTVSHPWNKRDNLLTWVEQPQPGKSEPEALAELRDARITLMQHLHRPQPYLAWPCGWYNERLIQMAQDAGYTALFTAEDGLNKAGDDVLHIKRTFIDGACSLQDFARSVRDGRYRVCQTHEPPTLGHRPAEQPSANQR